jgi:hypothetical protein
MTKSKLIQVLKTFSKEEFRSFGKFVSSPFFYKDKAVIKLYDSLKPFYPDLNDESITKKLLFERMYPKKQYSDSQMKYLMSEMLSLAKKFLTYKNFDNDYFEQNNRLLRELIIRNTDIIFEIELRKIENRIKHVQIMNKEYFYQMYRMKELVSDFYSYKDRLSVRREQNKIYDNIINNFLISLLDFYYEIINDAADFGVKIDLDLLSFIENFMKKNKNTAEPFVLIYYYIFMLTYRKEQLYYNKLLDLKNENLHILDDHGKHRIFEALGNYCIIRYQQEGIKYYTEAFNLINDEIKNGIRFSRKEFSEIFFQ